VERREEVWVHLRGGGEWYSGTLRRLLTVGDRVWVKIPRHGFVGVGRVTGPALPAKNFHVPTREGTVRLLDVGKGEIYDIWNQFADDPERCEWFVPVRWLQTVPTEEAINEKGMVGFRHTVCKPKSVNGFDGRTTQGTVSRFR
jgi:hypothetical protein